MEKFNLDLSLVARLGGHSQPRTHRGKERFPGMTITYALIQMLEKAQLRRGGHGSDTTYATCCEICEDACRLSCRMEARFSSCFLATTHSHHAAAHAGGGKDRPGSYRDEGQGFQVGHRRQRLRGLCLREGWPELPGVWTCDFGFRRGCFWTHPVAF